MFSLLGMISRYGPTSLMFKHALFSLENDSPHSWFNRLESLCSQYGLPNKMSFLKSPLPNALFKKQIKEKVVCFWYTKLSVNVQKLQSLSFLRPKFLPLGRGRPLLF